MNWSDVLPYTTMIRPGEVDYDDGWANGEKALWRTDHAHPRKDRHGTP